MESPKQLGFCAYRQATGVREVDNHLHSQIPRGSYPTPVLGRLLFKITGPNHKTRYPKKGVGYEPLGTELRFRGFGSLGQGQNPEP